MRENNLDSIQVVRGIAALLVLLYHASALFKMRFSYDCTDYFWWGYSGVDIFFVLSGFIIVYSCLINPKLTPNEFFARRLLRIYPVYWIAIAAILALAVVSQKIGIGDSSTITKVYDTSLTAILGTLLLIPKQSEIILVAWTLSYEMTFYLIFTLLFFKSRRAFFLAMSGWAIASVVAAFYFNVDFQNTTNPVVALLNPIMIEFLFGIGVAYAYISGKLPIKMAIFLLIANCLAFYSNVYYFHDTLINIGTNNQYSRFFLYGSPAALIMYCLLSLPIGYHKILTFIGDASYSIYLFHYPILGVLAKILLLTHLPLNNVIGFSLLLLITTAICSLIYWLIEKPILDYGKKKIKQRKMELSYQ